MRMTADMKHAAFCFVGLIGLVSCVSAEAAPQEQRPDFTTHQRTLVDFLKPEIRSFRHGEAWTNGELLYVGELRKHVAKKSLQVQKECAYESIRLQRRLYEATESRGEAFDLLVDLKRNPTAYTGRPLVLYGRVQRVNSDRNGNRARLLDLGTDTYLLTWTSLMHAWFHTNTRRAVFPFVLLRSR